MAPHAPSSQHDSTAGHDAPGHRRSGRPRRRGRPPLREVVSPEEIVRVLETVGEPQSARQLRAALGVPPTYLSGEVTELLREATLSGRVQRTGKAVGTRYHPRSVHTA
ncbi:hypothetical protein AB0L40_08705 [Patulibacter sp. NPDC049589]|uniref:hypothetical protein n=1 Tax=Patulibacter sp. NPDC049589 TaxID=3154731 RepID=UPI003444B898